MHHRHRLSSCYVLTPRLSPSVPIHWRPPVILCCHHGPLSPTSFSLTVFLSPLPFPIQSPHLPRCLVVLPITDCCSRSLCGAHPPSCPPCLFSGVERTLLLPGSQTTFDLDDVRAGLSYTVRVSARVGAQEGDASILTIHRGEHLRRLTGDGDRLAPCPHTDLSPLSLTPRSRSPTCCPRTAGCRIRCNKN